MTRTRYAMIALTWLAVPAAGLAQVNAPLSPYPPCHPNKASTSPCVCGARPSLTCPTGAWCSYTPEGAPSCSRQRPLHR